MLQIPSSFRKNVLSEWGEKGETWLNELPTIVETCPKRWRLELAPSSFEMSFGFEELHTSKKEERLIHGDLHHENILLDEHRGWIAIDKAKGLSTYARDHGEHYGRILLMIIDDKDRLRALNLNKESVRNEVNTVTSKGHLEKLFADAPQIIMS